MRLDNIPALPVDRWQIVTEHRDLVPRVTRRIVNKASTLAASDITVAVENGLIHGAESCDPANPKLRGYLWRSCFTSAISFLRSRRREAMGGSDDITAIGTVDAAMVHQASLWEFVQRQSSPEDMVGFWEIGDAMQSRISRQQAEILTMRASGFNQVEIALKLGLSEAMVSRELSFARLILAELI